MFIVWFKSLVSNSETILPLALYLFFKENFELFNTLSGNLKPDFARSIILQFVYLSWFNSYAREKCKLSDVLKCQPLSLCTKSFIVCKLLKQSSFPSKSPQHVTPALNCISDGGSWEMSFNSKPHSSYFGDHMKPAKHWILIPIS